MSVKITSLIDFINLTNKVREIERRTFVPGHDRYENDSEHGYQLALTALFIIESDHLQLDPYKTMAMALVHDLPEAYAGDTPVHGHEHLQATKTKRETAAIAQLRREWPDIQLMHDLIDEYEQRTSPESIFVYALDKLAPVVNHYLDGGRSWHASNVTFERMLAVKTAKIATDPTVKRYYDQLVDILRDKPELFAQEQTKIVA